MAKVKTITVGYTLLGNNPNNRKIDKQMSKWLNKGYSLENRTDTDVGCCMQILLVRGKTTLTFVKRD